MKKQAIALFFVFSLFMLISCGKEDNPAPAAQQTSQTPSPAPPVYPDLPPPPPPPPSYPAPTSPLQPIVWTYPAIYITATGAALQGTVNFFGYPGQAWFVYAPSMGGGPCGISMAYKSTPKNPYPSSYGDMAFSWMISGLAPHTTYYYCAVATNAVDTTVGNISSFATP